MESSKKVFDADFGDVIEAHAEGFKDGRREGVIEGLERALTLFPNAHAVTQWDPQDAIRDTLERLRAEQKEG